MSPQVTSRRRRTTARTSAPEVPLRGVRFVETKLRSPRLRHDAIQRTRLLRSLHEALTTHPLTLLSAPAGYGKTTTLTLFERAHPEVSVAWLSVDEDDNDPNLFAAAMVAALRQVHPNIGVEAQELLPGLDGIGRALMNSLINDVIAAHAAPLVLVLDDFHRVTESSIARAIEYLIERMPPQMHLVIAARHDPQLPLPRLRVRHQIAEVRLDALRFDDDEARELLNDTLGLELTDEHITILQNRTEGWPAGLSLLVGALRRLIGPLDRDAFLSHLLHFDRYVFDFLASEVLDTLGSVDRQFLLDLSILHELTPEVCQAVTLREDASHALQDLYARNLFVVALDQPATVFRFHDLFRDFLQHRLRREQPDRLRELHRRAARAERINSRSIAHFLAAEAWDEAAVVIENFGEATLREGALATLSGWIHALPDEVVAAHPRLDYLQGVAAWTRFNLSGTIDHLSRAVAGFRARGDRQGLGPALVYLSNVVGAVGDFEQALLLTEEASQCDLPMVSRLSLLIQETWFDMAAGEPARAVEAFDAALDLIEAADDPDLVHALARAIHCYLFGLPGATSRMERFARVAMPHARNGAAPLRATALTMLAWAQQWRGRSEQAAATAHEALAIADRLGVRSVQIEAGLLQAVLSALRGDAQKADQLFDALFDELQQPDAAAFTDAWLAGYLLALGRVRLLQGRLDDARAAEQRIRRIENLREWPIAPLARALFRGLLQAAEGDEASAEASLREAVSLQERIRVDYFAGDARTALAALLANTGRRDEAVAIFADVLAEHERERTPGAMVWEGPPVRPLLRLAIERGVHAQFAAQVLRLSGERTDEAERRSVLAPSGEPLSPRELEVLQLIADGASNAAIAAKLVISVHTVKRHVANVLQKLAVGSRAEAGAVARRLRLAD